jgi:hypothetical protein
MDAITACDNNDTNNRNKKSSILFHGEIFDFLHSVHRKNAVSKRSQNVVKHDSKLT